MIFMSFESTIVFLLTLLHPFWVQLGSCQRIESFKMHALPSDFLFSDEQFDQNGEKKFRVGGGGGGLKN